MRKYYEQHYKSGRTAWKMRMLLSRPKARDADCLDNTIEKHRTERVQQNAFIEEAEDTKHRVKNIPDCK